MGTLSFPVTVHVFPLLFVCEVPHKPRGDFHHTRQNIILAIFSQFECMRNPLPPQRPQCYDGPFCSSFPQTKQTSSLLKITKGKLFILKCFFPSWFPIPFHSFLPFIPVYSALLGMAFFFPASQLFCFQTGHIQTFAHHRRKERGSIFRRFLWVTRDLGLQTFFPCAKSFPYIADISASKWIFC